MFPLRRVSKWSQICNALKQQHMFYGSSKITKTTSPLTFLTEDETIMKETVAKFAKEQIAPLVSKMDAEGHFDPALIKSIFDHGLMAIKIPAKYGGSESNFMTTILVIEEISKVDAAVAFLVDIHNTLLNNFIIKLGTEDQKTRYLPKLAMKTAGSFALSEPSSGSDAFALKTTAKKDGDYYLFNGTKMWISHANIADVFVVFVNADPSKGYRGISTFIVDRDTPGFSIRKRENKLGIHASGTCTLHFDNARVHKDNVLGEIGQGYKYAAGYLTEGRIGIAAQQIGIAQGCFDATVPYLFERQQFGKEIYDFQSLQHQVAKIATQIEAARLLTYNAARLFEAGEPFVKQSSMAKYFAAEVSQATTISWIDWMGGVGFTKDFPQEKFYRDCKCGAIYEGTANIQLNTIAKTVGKEFS